MRQSLPVALAVLALGVTGCQLPGKPKPGPEVPRPEQVMSFTELYGQNCAGCHGAHGANGAATDLANPEYEAWIDDAWLRNVIAKGEKGVLMPAFSVHSGGDLTDQQIDVIVRGMRSTWGKPDAFGGATPPPYAPANAGNAPGGGSAASNDASSPAAKAADAAKSGNAAKAGSVGNGQAVYTAACARCHGADAEHPGPAGSVLDGSYLALINEQTVRSTIVPGRPDVGQPDWRGLVRGRPLTDAEVTDVSAWLIAQTPAHPGHPYPTSNRQPATQMPGEQQPMSEKKE